MAPKFLKTIIRRVVITALTEGNIRTVSATGLAGEEFNEREFQQQYGFASSPKANAEGVMAGVGNVFYLLASDDRRYRITLVNGEVALYTDEDDKIHLKRGNIIEITAATKVIVNAPAVELGDGTLKKLINEELVTKFNQHTHPTAALGAPSTPTTPIVLADVTTVKTKAS